MMEPREQTQLYKGRSVLVTGGKGFIGSHLVDELVSQQAHVTVVDNASNNPYQNRDAKYIDKDILDPNLFAEPKAFDYIFHLAARCDLNGESLEDYKVNYLGTLNLLSSLRLDAVKKFVFYSTQLVVGIFNETRFIGPEEPYKTATKYGLSKIAGELIVKKFCKKHNVPYSIVRPTSVYGPRGGVPYRDFFLSISQGRFVHVGRASNLVSMSYVKNLIDLTLLVGSANSSNAQIYFGTDFHPYTMREIVETSATFFHKDIITIPEWIMWLVAYGFGVLKFIGFNPPIYPFRLKNILSNYCYDIQNAVRLGYDPKYDLDKSINETLSWYIVNDKQFA